MGRVFKPLVYKALPDAAELFTRKGERFAKWTDRRGRTRTAPVAVPERGKHAGELRIVVESSRYVAKYRDAEGLQAGYDKHIVAYDRIFDRCGLEWYRVESDVGMMGGLGAHEYMALCAAGENDVALAPGYAANVEIACAEAQGGGLFPSLDAPERRCSRVSKAKSPTREALTANYSTVASGAR